MADTKSSASVSDQKPKRRILIVEDSKPVRETIEMFCRQLGFETGWATTLDEATLQVRSGGLWDCVILDGSINNDTVYTGPLIPVIKQCAPECIIIANSSEDLFAEALMKWGATFRTPFKEDFIQFFRKLCSHDLGWT